MHFLLVSLLAAACGSFAAAATMPEGLQCLGAVDPLGVDVQQPTLGWRLVSDRRGERQTAWQIQAATTPERLAQGTADLWDSGRVAGDQTLGIAYAGISLSPYVAVYWKVRAWDRDGTPTDWSSPATWVMGPIEAKDWQGSWITGGTSDGTGKDPQSLRLRRDFTVKTGLRRAVVVVCGLGHYEMTLNGSKVGTDLLSPGWTNYAKTCLYDTFDITGQVKPGANAVGLELGNGMYRVVGGRYTKFMGSFGPQKAIANLRFDYADGTSEIVATDGTWSAAPGPITFSCVYGGEDYDARQDLSGWDQPGHTAPRWTAAVPCPGPGGQLRGVSESAPPIRAIETLTPVATKPLKPGVSVVDLGQNASIIPRLVVRGPAGSTVRLIPAELVKGDGDIHDPMCSGKSFWTYTVAGRGTETWFPKFFYRGSRYLRVELTAAPGSTELPVVEALTGVVVHSGADAIGLFSCANDLFNRTHTLIRWAQRSNLVSVLTDCPHREKLGWLEQTYLNGPSLRFNYGLDRLFTKIGQDMADGQLANGLVPNIAPEYVRFGGERRNAFGDSPEWSSAFLMVPWQQYEFTGDLTLMRRHYAGMKGYVAYLGTRAKDHIVDYGLGDWYDLGPKGLGKAQLTPVSLTATALYFADADVLARMAKLLGQDEDARTYAALAESIRGAFTRRFFHAETGTYATGSQCANALPLVLGLVRPEDKPRVVEALVADVQAKGLTAGDVGYRYLLRALADHGRSDVIYALNNQSDKPGYGYQLKLGKTSLTEGWDGSASQNHFMLGQLNEWMYHDLAGIRPDPAGPGFSRIVIKPALVADLAWAKARYVSVRGPIASSWSRAAGTTTLTVEIPANTVATVWVPTQRPAEVQESGVAMNQAPGVRVLPPEEGCARFEIGSGRYVFTSK